MIAFSVKRLTVDDLGLSLSCLTFRDAYYVGKIRAVWLLWSKKIYTMKLQDLFKEHWYHAPLVLLVIRGFGISATLMYGLHKWHFSFSPRQCRIKSLYSQPSMQLHSYVITTLLLIVFGSGKCVEGENSQ